MAGGGYDIGAGFSGSASSGASQGSAMSRSGGGVNIDTGVAWIAVGLAGLALVGVLAAWLFRK